MKKVLVMGQANVGKSAIFNRLARGTSVTESNYPGTTVDFSKGKMLLDNEWMEIIDVPGTFSLEPKDAAEEIGVRIFNEEKDATVICVIDSSKIERGLYLALELIERGHPVVIALNMWDVAKERNIKIDAWKLEKILGVSIVPTMATKGEGIKELASRIKAAKPIGIENVIKNLGVHFSLEQFGSCPLIGKCPVLCRKQFYSLLFSDRQALLAQRRQKLGEEEYQEKCRLRPAIEGTISQFQHTPNQPQTS